MKILKTNTKVMLSGHPAVPMTGIILRVFDKEYEVSWDDFPEGDEFKVSLVPFVNVVPINK